MFEQIILNGVRVHNLKGVSLDIPYEKLIVFCGRSGSGKSSLAMDTLFVEGQRRYIESFSVYTRQFLAKLEKPDAERIEGVPPAIAVTTKPFQQISRATVGTMTETTDYLRLLFSKIGKPSCPCCGVPIQSESPQTILETIKQLPSDTRLMLAFAPDVADINPDRSIFQSEWQEFGFLRGVALNKTFRLDDGGIPQDIFQKIIEKTTKDKENPGQLSGETGQLSTEIWKDDPDVTNDSFVFGESQTKQVDEDIEDDQELETKNVHGILFDSEKNRKTVMSAPLYRRDLPKLFFIPDRLVIGKANDERILESLEATMQRGGGRCYVFTENSVAGKFYSIDGETWGLLKFSRHLECETCGVSFPKIEPRFFSFNSPMGACPVCEGFGNLMIFDMDLIVPNRNKSIRDGAIAPWNSPSYKKKLDELIDVAPRLGIPVNVPFSELTEEQVQLLIDGSPKQKFQGLSEFFEKLQKQKYKMHIRVYLSRWRSFRKCPSCLGARIRHEALAVKVQGKNIAEICAMQVSEVIPFMKNLEFELPPWEREIAKTPLIEVRGRLEYLEQVGLGYLTPDRTIRTLSGGEQRRIGLTASLGSSLVNMLYVLDEPSMGLHPNDTDKLLQAIQGLRDRGNTIVVVEHEEAILRAADRIVEIGPEAGTGGGHITFEGSIDEMLDSETSLTGSYLSGKRTGGIPSKRRKTEHGFLELTGARGNNLKNISVSFPLGLLCVVTGVSGSGKSSLIQETLYPALCQKFRDDPPRKGLPFDQILGTGQLDDVIMVDQSPIGRSPRSNPVTYLKIFDEIRSVFAETMDAKTRNFTAGHFSFNVDGGRCDTCHGDGVIVIDMQFMADMYMKCPQCHGTRYQREILEITYRGRNIAEVLEMTVREAFGFFRGQTKVQMKLKRLMDVGLDYIHLGQPANTLSGGELQRLKLAAHLSQTRKGHSLFLLDEPTTGLHFADIVQLLDCFDALIETGHSLIVVEHNLQMIRAADYVIDLGPGAAEQGGNIVAQGSPEEIAQCRHSITGVYLGL